MPLIAVTAAAAEHLAQQSLGVVPVVVGPLQILIAIAPGLFAALLGWFLAVFKPSSLKIGAKLLWRFKLQVIAAVAVVWGLSWAWERFVPHHTATTGTAAKGEDWTMFRGGSERSGWAASATAARSNEALRGPNQPGSAWVAGWRKPDWQILASPTVVGDRIYFPTASITAFNPDGKGRIVCLNADNGNAEWIWDGAALDGYRATFSSPAVAGKFLVIGEGLHFCKNARIYCFDISSGTPKKLWSYATNDHVESSPAIQLDPDGQNGVMVVGAGVDGYYAFDLMQKDPARPKPRWRTHGGSPLSRASRSTVGSDNAGTYSVDAESSPLIHDGKVYVGNGNGMNFGKDAKLDGEGIQCLDLATGKQVWKLKTGYPVFGPSTIIGRKLYVGMGNGDFINAAEVVREEKLKHWRDNGADGATIDRLWKQLAPGGAIWCVDIDKAVNPGYEPEWIYATPQAVLSAVAHSAGRLVFTDTAGVVYAISAATGRTLGTWNAGAPIMASPAVTDTTAYILPTSGLLYALDIERMRPEWESFIGAGGLFLGSPAVAHQSLFVPSGDHGLQAVGRYSNIPPAPLWPQARGGQSGSGDGSPIPIIGNLAWTWPKNQDDNTANPVRVGGAVAVVDGQVLIPVAAGAQAGLVAIAHQVNATEPPAPRWHVDVPLGVYGSPVVIDNLAVVISGRAGERGRELLAITATGARAGTVAWRHSVTTSASSSLVANSSVLVTQLSEHQLSVLLLHGTTGYSMESRVAKIRMPVPGSVLWTVPLVGAYQGAAIADTTIIATTATMAVCLSRADGALLWHSELPISGAPVIAGDRVLLNSRNGVIALHLGDGKVVERWSAPGAGGPIVCTTTMVAQVTVTGELILMSADSGEVMARYSNADPAVAPIISRGMVLFVSREGKWQLVDGANSAAPQVAVNAIEWTDTAWLSGVSTPPVLAGSGVYVGLGIWGLARLSGGR